MKNIATKKEGFVILFAVTISSILLTIALGVANISYKEITFGSSAKDSNDAFFAADTGAECALKHDSSVSTSNAFVGTSTMTCRGVAVAVTATSSTSWSFNLTGLGYSGVSCAKVSVSKPNNTDTFITSKGYNVGDSSCNWATPRVERQIDLQY